MVGASQAAAKHQQYLQIGGTTIDKGEKIIDSYEDFYSVCI
jgi:hypothetical protein